MKILADENCEREMIDALRLTGYDVVTILDTSPSVDDRMVFGRALTEGRVLLTSDRDFGVIAERSEMRPPAIILMRLERVGLRVRIGIVLSTLAGLGDDIDRQFVVIEPHQVRTRVYEP